jgi:hypothetical protein
MRLVLALLIALLPMWVFADIIYFKDGMKTICQERAWEQDGEIKCEYEGIVIIYEKADVLRIQEIRTKKPVAKPKQKPKAQEKRKPQKARVQAAAVKPGDLVFYDPRRKHKYWTGANAKHKNYDEAIAALAKQYGRTPDWVKSHMGETNNLTQIHQNLSGKNRPETKTKSKVTEKDSYQLKFYNPRRKHKYWTSRDDKYNTFQEAVTALAVQYERPSDWVKSHMGETNDLNQIHHNLTQRRQEENSQ